MSRFTLHLAVGRALRLELTKYGSLGGYWGVPGIALPDPPSIPIPRVHPLPTHPARVHLGARVSGVEYGRGALIGRPTHFKGPFLAVKDYYRGI